MTAGPQALRCCGVRVYLHTRASAADRIVEAAQSGTALAAHLCNAYVLSLAARDPDYAALLDRGDLNVADGAPVVWLARRLGVSIQGARPSGTELVHLTMERTRDGDIGHYLYGSSDEVVAAMADALARTHPGVRIVAAESPPYRPLMDEEYGKLVADIQSAGPVVVWIGTGTPKQDYLVDRLQRDVSAPVIPVGAAFDFIAGAKERAPRWMQKAGLEWSYRLITEPRRLWRRYLIDSASFFWHARHAEVVTEAEVT